VMLRPSGTVRTNRCMPARTGRALWAAAMAFPLMIITPPLTAGHAFGSFSVSVFSQITVAEREVRVRWVLDMAELPAGAIVKLMDTDADGVLTPTEEAAYLDIWISSVLEALELQVDAEDLFFKVVSRDLSFPIGEGGSPALRLVMDMSTQLPLIETTIVHQATYRDTNYIEYIGWREVAVGADEGVRLIDSSVPVEGRTQELTIYPPDLGMGVPTSEAHFTFSIATPDASSGADSPSADASFKLWPTGVLAILVVLLLGLLAVILDRSAPTTRRR
jgi:hypothetical protein